MIDGSLVMNAVPLKRGLQSTCAHWTENTQNRLQTAVVAAARQAAESEGVGFRTETKMGIDYSKARPKEERLKDPVVQTALATNNYFRKVKRRRSRRRMPVRPTPISR